MEDQAQTQTQTQAVSSPGSQCLERNEPVRSRWTPKPEQILILESIFNSGMVNPPKEETVKIRKLLEKFGSVGDANVFYWFQNRRSRSRRRQRQIQASLIGAGPRCDGSGDGGGDGGAGGIEYPHTTGYTTSATGFVMQQSPDFLQTLPGCSSSTRLGEGGVSEIYGQASSFIDIDHHTSMPSNFLQLDTSKLHYEFASGVMITVFINGVPTEVGNVPLNIKALFGEDLMLVHSSGVPVALDEFGVSVSCLQHGESYFLVSNKLNYVTN